MSREQLVSIARRNIEHHAAGTQDQADGVVEEQEVRLQQRAEALGEMEALYFQQMDNDVDAFAVERFFELFG